jgi:hypothetical protein
MKRTQIPNDAVLLIPEPESGELPTCGVAPGYYNPKQMLELIEKHLSDANAIEFIANMLETGVAENDGFANTLRANMHNADALQRIVAACRC